jgi:hypothetical protein
MDATDGSPPSFPTADPEPAGHMARDHSHSQPFQDQFPTAGDIFGRASSFIDRFNDDAYASHRVHNSYYPFADQDEWELGSFLLGSGMSMHKVDEFLKLKLVF